MVSDIVEKISLSLSIFFFLCLQELNQEKKKAVNSLAFGVFDIQEWFQKQVVLLLLVSQSSIS